MNPGYCVKLSRIFGRHDAEDLCQELLLLSWQLRGKDEGYIKRSVRNRAIDFYRRQKRANTLFCGLEEAAQVAENGSERAFSAFVCLLAAIEASPRLVKGISEGFTMREMAAKLGVSPATVYKRLRAVREAVGGDPWQN